MLVFTKMSFFVKSTNFWKNLSKVWQNLNEEYMKGLNKTQMRWQIRLPLQLLSFRKRQIFNKNGEFDKGWSTHKWVDKLRKHVKNWVPVEIEPWVVPDLMVRNDREISDNGRDIVIKKKQSIFIVVDENISSDWNTSINASRWN